MILVHLHDVRIFRDGPVRAILALFAVMNWCFLSQALEIRLSEIKPMDFWVRYIEVFQLKLIWIQVRVNCNPQPPCRIPVFGAGSFLTKMIRILGHFLELSKGYQEKPEPRHYQYLKSGCRRHLPWRIEQVPLAVC